MLCKGEDLYDNTRLDEYEIRLLTKALLLLGKKINNKIKSLNALVNNELPYSFYKMHDYDTIILKLRTK